MWVIQLPDGSMSGTHLKASTPQANDQSALLKPLCEAQLAYLTLASQHSKPAASAIAPLLKPQADAIGAIMEAKDKLGRTKEGREWGGCLSVVAEGVSAWGWVQVVSSAFSFREYPVVADIADVLVGARACSIRCGDEKRGSVLGG